MYLLIILLVTAYRTGWRVQVVVGGGGGSITNKNSSKPIVCGHVQLVFPYRQTDRQSSDNHLGKHLSQMLGGGVVAALLQVGLHLVLHLGLVQVPGVLLLGVLAGRGVRGSGDLVDGAGLLQYLVRQLLGRGQHLGVVGRDQILDELLQLLPVHLEQSLTDGDPDGDLVRVPDPVDGESHNMLAPEDISAVTAAGHAGYLASANKLKISAGSKFSNNTNEVLSESILTRAVCFHILFLCSEPHTPPVNEKTLVVQSSSFD